MDDLDVLARGYGFRPQGKSNPMRSDGGDRHASSTRSSFTVLYDDDRSSRGSDGVFFNEFYGGTPKYTINSNSNNSKPFSTMNDFDSDSNFNSMGAAAASGSNSNNPRMSSAPVYDKPVYDDDIFNGLSGVKSKSVSSASGGRFDDDGFASMVSPTRWGGQSSNSNRRHDESDDLLGKLSRSQRENSKSSSASAAFDLLGNLTRNEPVSGAKSSNISSSSRDFDDLLDGFGSGGPANSKRPVSESNRGPKSVSNLNRSTSNVTDDPFVMLDLTSPPVSSSPGIFTDPLEEIGNVSKAGRAKTDTSSVAGGVFEDLDPLNGFGKSVPPFSPEKSSTGKDKNPLRPGSSVTEAQTAGNREHVSRSFKLSENYVQRNAPNDSFDDSQLFDMPNVSVNSQKSFRQNTSSPPNVSTNINETNYQANLSPGSEELEQQDDDVWLTVSEIPLSTQPTSAPPPSRPPPPIPRQTSKSETDVFSSNSRKKSDDFASPVSYSSYSQSPKGVPHANKGTSVTPIDELEDFAMGRTQNSADEANFHSGEEMNASSVAAASAAAMKEAMERAEAKFRHAKVMREREYAKGGRNRESTYLEKDEQATQDDQEREFRENQERLEQERRQREEEEREQRRLERLREIENARARQAVERANREARERAATEARLKAERAAVEKAKAEARERAERAAVQRAQAEARERAAAEAKERAEKTAAEARERANAEARDKESREKEARDRAAVERAANEARRRAERAAAERAAAEARERAAAEAREKAANAARVNQQKNDNDLESFFGMGSRPSSAPRPRTSSPDTMFDTQFNTGASQSSKANPFASSSSSMSSSSSSMRKASSTANMVDDLSSIFGAPSAGEFQEVEGETEERRRARLERHQRTQERAAKALAEKNQRDIQAQREQEERHRIAETLDIEIKRWAAGKEGNLRALLSTLQYVLWPEIGWQPVSLTDLIVGASVKKAYRKATLCIHPDKVQQKGATLQQKYIAEKVFDLLKEAWNKFNSEELF